MPAQPFSRPISRRVFLGGAAAAIAAAAAGTKLLGGFGGGSDGDERFPGHRPGQIYLGMSSPDLAAAVASVGEIGAQRSFFGWEELDRELAAIEEAHQANRLPWVSFKPPEDSSEPWADVASGRYDADLAERAEAYQATRAPVIATFHHEPHGDDEFGTPSDFAAAWTRVHDVMSEEQELEHIAFAPIVGHWVFNPSNEEVDPAALLTAEVLERADLLGFDVYQTASGESFGDRMEDVLEWLEATGANHPLGIGETGCSDSFGQPGAAAWWREAWAWMTTNTDRVGVVSYFNSNRNSRADWRLEETPEKQEAFRESLTSDHACRLSR